MSPFVAVIYLFDLTLLQVKSAFFLSHLVPAVIRATFGRNRYMYSFGNIFDIFYPLLSLVPDLIDPVFFTVADLVFGSLFHSTAEYAYP